MARKKIKDKPKLVDSGTVAGSMAAAAVLALWLFVEFSSATPGDTNTSGEGDSGAGNTTSSSTTSEGDVAPPPVQYESSEPAWKQDSRWDQSINLGEEGLQQADDAIKWNENVGGDPFYFANQIKEAGDKVGQSIRILQALKKDHADSPQAEKDIDKWLKYFERKLPRHSK